MFIKNDICFEKMFFVIEKKFWKFEAEGKEFANNLRLLKVFIQKVKGQNNS